MSAKVEDDLQAVETVDPEIELVGLAHGHVVRKSACQFVAWGDISIRSLGPKRLR
jgi:hypothetical protein